MRLLARREHGAHELANKLAVKGYSDTAIQEALQKCQRLGLQSDDRFVEHVCHTRIRQGYGPVRIRQELQNLQIAREMIDAVLHLEQCNWLSHAMDVWKKKYKDDVEPSYADVQKQKQFLLYRGFSVDTITQIFKVVYIPSTDEF